MNTRAIIPLVAGLCIGGVALKMVFDTVKRAKGAQTKYAAVLSAQGEIPLSSLISEGSLTTIKFPEKAVPLGAFTKKEDLVGRVPRVSIVPGVPIVEDMLYPEGVPPGLVPPSGFRAVAVKIDESSGVDYHLYPGCFVDVIGYFNSRRAGKQETIARTLVENVEVAAVGDRIAIASTSEDGGQKESGKPIRAATLYVKPETVPILHLAEQKGKLKLSMRNQNDATGVGNKKDGSTDTVDFSVVLTGKSEEEGEPKGILSWFLGGKQDEQPVVQVAAMPEPEPEKKPGWSMRVVNGADEEVVDYVSPNSRELFEPKKKRGNSRADRFQPPPNPYDRNTGRDYRGDRTPEPEPKPLPQEPS